MQVTSKDGKRTVRLERGEHSALIRARNVCSDLAELADDKDAMDAVDHVATLVERYAPPPVKARKSGGAS